jgi:hypothetical protein
LRIVAIREELIGLSGSDGDDGQSNFTDIFYGLFFYVQG